MTVGRARSIPVLLEILAALLLVGAALATAVSVLYTAPAFHALGLHPLALEVVDGAMTVTDLRAFARDGLAFTEREIRHLVDVKVVVGWARTSALLLAICLALLSVARPNLMRPAATAALALYLGTLALLAAAVVLLGPAATFDALHRLAFEPGSFVFEKQRLMAQLYGNPIVLRGAVSVAGLTLGLLACVWAPARLLCGRGLLQAGSLERDTTERTPDP